MDKQLSPESLNIYDYLDAHNIKSVGSGDNDTNYLTNLDGTILVTQNLPSGQNKCVGSKGFENIGKAYFIRYNSAGRHQLLEFNFNSLTETVLFENLTHSGNSDIFNLTPETYFNDIRLVHENFLILNDGVNPIYCINIELLKNQISSSEIIQETDLLLIKVPPFVPAKLEYFDNTDRTSNSLRGRLFQFRYQYEYIDGRTSSWSTISERPVPEDEPSEGQGQNVTTNNVLSVTLPIGDNRVSKINIAVRENNWNWLLVKEVSRDYILNLQTTDPNPPNSYSVPESYNPNTNEYQFGFYNDGLYAVLDQIETNLQYDYVPKKAETVEVINGNVLAVGGLTEGYDRPDIDDFSANITYYEADLGSYVTDPENDFILRNINAYSTSEYRYWDMYFNGNPSQGDVIRISIIAIGQATPLNYSYTVTLTDQINGRNYTLNSFANTIAPQMPFGSGENLTFYGFFEEHVQLRTRRDGSQWSLHSITVVRQNVGSLSTKSINTLKNGASYQLAYAPYDRFGRYFPIVTDDRFIINTQTSAQTSGMLPQINWRLQEEAPEGAVGYQILLSENRTYEKYVTLTGVVEENAETGGDYLVFNLKSLDRFANFEKDSQVNYDFTVGDRVTLIKGINDKGLHVMWVSFPFVELDIVSFEIVAPTDNTDTKYLLTVRNTPLMDKYLDDPFIREFVMELYTPKKENVDSTQEFFYEIGLNYPIVDGKHTVTFGSITKGDSYFRGRLYRSSITEEGFPLDIADPHFSDNYESNFWSAGRARLYNDETGETERKGSIRYSDEYIYGSKYNGIGRFYSERIYGENGGETTSKYGWIRKLETRNNAVVCIQEFKVGVIPSYKAIISDNANQDLVADSTRIFGHVQYRNGDYGIGNAKESFSVSNDGVMYFLDDNHCVPLRDSLSGLDVIDRNMRGYFIEYVNMFKNTGSKFIGVYDNFNKEYNLTATDTNGEVIDISIREDNTIYTDNLPPLSSVNILSPEHGEIEQNSWMVTYTADEGYVGSDVLLLESELEQVKPININIIEGDRVPDQFNLNNLVNQLQNTVVESVSIVVSGITAPSPLTITGGEYRINNGDWSTTPVNVLDNDSVQVRHTTASSVSGQVSTTLTIGGVSSTFTSTTVGEGVDPNNYNNLTLYVYPSEVTTGTVLNAILDYGLKLSSDPVIVVEAVYIDYTFQSFGGISKDTRRVLFSNGSTDEFVRVEVLPTNMSTAVINQPSGFLQDGEIRMCSDDVLRVVKIRREAIFEVPDLG